MLLREILAEDADRDLAIHQEALKLTSATHDWLASANSRKPVKNIFRKLEDSDGTLWLVPVPARGPVADNLFFGVTLKGPYDNMDATVAVKKVNDRTIYLVLVLLEEPFEDSTNLHHRLNWKNILHEFVHVIDMRRSNPDLNSIANIASGNHDAYFNHALELNAYFQEGLAGVLRVLSTGNQRTEAFPFGSFVEFNEFAMPFFRADWTKALTDSNKKRVTRRLYKLYDKLRSDWKGNLPVIRQYQSRLSRPAVWERFKTWVGW